MLFLISQLITPGCVLSLGREIAGENIEVEDHLVVAGRTVCVRIHLLLPRQEIPSGPHAGIFGGEGFIMQKVSGTGIAFAEIDGDLIEYQLEAGQQMVVDTGYVAGFESTVSIDIQQVAGLKNKMLGGEGFFNTVLTGPGRIWLQTMPISGVANAIRPFIPSS